MPKLLLVDDEPTLVATVKFNLEKEGLQVVVATDGDSAVAVLREAHPDLVILDLMLPGMSGLEVCRIVRQESVAPIVVLTAKTEEIDKVVALELGADVYITKPFSMKELIARVRARLRRVDEGARGSQPEIIDIGALRLDLLKREVTKSGSPVDLRPKE